MEFKGPPLDETGAPADLWGERAGVVPHVPIEDLVADAAIGRLNRLCVHDLRKVQAQGFGWSLAAASADLVTRDQNVR